MFICLETEIVNYIFLCVSLSRLSQIFIDETLIFDHKKP